MGGSNSQTLEGKHEFPFTTECQVGAISSEMISKNWFVSESFDEDGLERIESIQLFTNARHQGRFSDPSTEMWSCHSNETRATTFVDNSGPRFERDHPLTRLLKPGNVNGVRICAQYPAWQTIANHGRLEVVFLKKGSTSSSNSFSIENNTARDISVRVTTTGEPDVGDENFRVIKPRKIEKWQRATLQVAFVMRDDNGLLETMGVKPSGAYHLGALELMPDPLKDPKVPIKSMGQVEARGEKGSIFCDLPSRGP